METNLFLPFDKFMFLDLIPASVVKSAALSVT